MDTSVFRERLYKLREEKNLSLDEAAKGIGISRATLGFYENGDRKPDITILKKIVEFYVVSSDYLIGLSNIRVPDLNVRGISEKAGLSEESICHLLWLVENQSSDDLEKHTPVSPQNILKTIDNIISSPLLLQTLTIYLTHSFSHFVNTSGSKRKPDTVRSLALVDKKTGWMKDDLYPDILSNIYLFEVIDALKSMRVGVEMDGHIAPKED